MAKNILPGLPGHHTPDDFSGDIDLDLWLDFETRSRCGLRTHGVYNYAQDGSTKVLCMSYAFGNEDVQTWAPCLNADEPFPPRVAAYLAKRAGKGRLKAHNAAFERLVFWYVVCVDLDLPEPDLELFYCTACESQSNGGPRKLEDFARFSGASMRKDHRGGQLVQKLCIPRADGTFNNDRDLLLELVEYCEQDVRTMRSACGMNRPMSEQELYDYHVNERINDRGVTVDRELAQAAQVYAEAELKEIAGIVLEVTGGEIQKSKSPKMRDWIFSRLGERAQKLMVVHKTDKQTKETTRKVSMSKDIRANLIALADEEPDQVPEDVAEMIQCVDDAWATSTAKFLKMDNLCDRDDDRLRGSFVFAGAPSTGRYSSYGAQLHNMGRSVMNMKAHRVTPDQVRAAIVAREDIANMFRVYKNKADEEGKPLRVFDIMKKMLRPGLMATVAALIGVADWSAIEARVTPWASNSPEGDAKLEQFRLDRDVYIENAAATFGITYEELYERYKAGDPDADRMRQIGKVQELACGFMGGIGAFHAMGRIYGVILTDAEAQSMVDAWRRANPWAKPYWEALKQAYMGAMRNPNVEFPTGRVTYMFDGTHLWYALPSGRILCYPFARIERGEYGPEVSYAKASFTPSADAKEWPRSRLWPGLACENITQAIANDLLREALSAFEDEFEDALHDGDLHSPAHIILHCHDEVAVECDEKDVDVVEFILQDIMTTPPEWCPDLPLKIGEPTFSTRYGK